MEQSGTNATMQQIDEAGIEPDEILKIQQDRFVTFMALGGLITEESDRPDQAQNIHQMTITEFCEKTGIPRTTFYRWKKIPGMGDKIRARRREVHNLNRETALYNRAYLIAMTSKDHKSAVEAIKLLQGHFAELDLPVQREVIKHEGESWIGFIQQKQQNVIEAEIVNDPTISNN